MLNEMLHFAKERRTIHIGFRHNEFRVVAKSYLFHPDTLIAKVSPSSLKLLQSGKRSVLMNCFPVDLQHAKSVDTLLFDLNKRTLTLVLDGQKEVFQFTEEEWKQLMEFLK